MQNADFFTGLFLAIKKFKSTPPLERPGTCHCCHCSYRSPIYTHTAYVHIGDIYSVLATDNAVLKFLLERKARYSYNFLHLSLQEYLAAIHVSLLDTRTQEILLESMCTQKHLKNTSVFLAAITHFKGLDREIVKHAIQSECEKVKEGMMIGALALSATALEIVFETGESS